MAPIKKQSDKVKVVLTGFEPFGRHLTNPSWLSVQPLNNTTLDLPTIAAAKQNSKHHNATKAYVVSQELPVEYRKVPDLVSALHIQHSRRVPSLASGEDVTEEHEEEDYLKTYYIHVGVGLDGYTVIETNGHRIGYSHPDNAKWSPESAKEPPVKKETWAADPDLLTTTVDSAALAEYLKTEKGWICKQSLDAGNYLCDYTFYLSMAERHRRVAAGEEGEDERTCLFVHLPSVGNPYSLEELQRFIKDVVVAVVSFY
ncbi:hypothetical protein BC939DRAFT_498001 [Gamsiella multidivaricata]|uniref:uncharacterized protein n=1 Tax=Gamsiella multidivaricata TaxID=101098 RepID=UPI00221EF7DB|nr:uncharacterized protein BC939DRAFT_498001 [Gamsiella multidivaricata]KAG0370202.1 hypothetical protein BGZ54_007311 [Gamsiella multidivaricata]KAI7832581.1 hypothetical protein BC939DRAFT_498001 [Gamsiella multidivaricata]